MVDYCNKEENKLGFTITADQSTSVMEVVYSIPEEDCIDAVSEDRIKKSYQIHKQNTALEQRSGR